VGTFKAPNFDLIPFCILSEQNLWLKFNTAVTLVKRLKQKESSRSRLGQCSQGKYIECQLPLSQIFWQNEKNLVSANSYLGPPFIKIIER
jgi:hypothetical protein